MESFKRTLILLILAFLIFSCCYPPKDTKYYDGSVIVEKISFGGKRRTTLKVRLVETNTTHTIFLGRRTKSRCKLKIGDVVKVQYYYYNGYKLKYKRDDFLH